MDKNQRAGHRRQPFYDYQGKQQAEKGKGKGRKKRHRATEPGPDYKALKCQLSFECLAKQANKGLLLVQGCRSIELKTVLLKH